MACDVCRRIERIRAGTSPYFVCALETGYVVLGDHQHFWGYTLFLYKEHVAELHHIPAAVRTRHLEEMALVYEAVYNAFRPEKINCESLGNSEAHMHWHLFPRITGDTPQKGPVWWMPKEQMYSERARPSAEALGQMKEALRLEIERLLHAP